MTELQHARWCITQCPCMVAEQTIWWFLNGSKDWDAWTASINYRSAVERILK